MNTYRVIYRGPADDEIVEAESYVENDSYTDFEASSEKVFSARTIDIFTIRKIEVD